MFVARAVFQPETLSERKFSAPRNMFEKSVTLLVLNEERSREVSAVQPQNI